MMKPRHSGPARLAARTRRAVTLTELLVVMVIITLLSTLIVPVAVNKAQQARVATAKAEIREIAHAMETCGAIHGFFVPIHMLDDLIDDVDAQDRDDNNYHTNDPPDEDDLYNEDRNNIFLIDPNRELDDQEGVAVQANLDDGYLDPSNANHNHRVRKLIDEWSGPFFTPKRVYEPPDRDSNSPEYLRRDFPLDPWGQPFLVMQKDAFTLTVHLHRSTPSSIDLMFLNK